MCTGVKSAAPLTSPQLPHLEYFTGLQVSTAYSIYTVSKLVKTSNIVNIIQTLLRYILVGFFCNGIVNIWNFLSTQIVNSNRIERFKENSIHT